MAENIFESLETSLATVEALSGRVYPTAAPESADTPHCVYTMSKYEPILTVDKPSGVSTYYFVLHIIAAHYAELIDVSNAVKQVVINIPKNDPKCLDVEWTEPASEAYESNWGVQRRSPTVKFIYLD